MAGLKGLQLANSYVVNSRVHGRLCFSVQGSAVTQILSNPYLVVGLRDKRVMLSVCLP